MSTATTSTTLPPDAMRAIEHIRGLIDTGEIGAHSRLPSESELASRLSVDAATVRLALDKLEADGMVWRDQPGGGDAPDERPTILHPSYEPMQVIEARLCIEPTLAALCAQRATSEEVGQLVSLVDNAEREPDNDVWDASLHRTIASLARSKALLAAFSVIEEARASPGWQVALTRARTPEHRAMYRKQHMAVVDAVCDRDPAAARWAMTEHLELLKRHMAVALGPR